MSAMHHPVPGSDPMECKCGFPWPCAAVYTECGVCDCALDYWIAFIGAPQMFETKAAFISGPMHKDCAEKIVAAVPPGAGPQAIGLTRSFTVRMAPQGIPIYRPAPFKHTYLPSKELSR